MRRKTLPLLKPSRSSDAFIRRNYILYDRFDTARAAGAVNGTNAEPVGGARTVTDTNSKISIADGKLIFGTGIVVNVDGYWANAITRSIGQAIICQFDITNNGIPRLGLINSKSGFQMDGIQFAKSVNQIFVIFTSVGIVIDVCPDSIYNAAIIVGANGMFYFAKSSSDKYYKLLYVYNVNNPTYVYPSIVGRTNSAEFKADNIRVPKRLYIPVPLQSDGFSAATTDGQGNAENNGPIGNTWTDAVGTWGVSGGARSCSALSGGLGFSYLPCQSSNVIIDAKVTRSAGVAGIVARYASATDYLIAYHDGTNAKLDKVVAGVTTNLVSAAATYSAGAVLRLILDGTSARLFYKNVAVGSVANTPAAGSLNHGLYTTDTGNTFDDLIIWARGNEGQYNGLDSL